MVRPQFAMQTLTGDGKNKYKQQAISYILWVSGEASQKFGMTFSLCLNPLNMTQMHADAKISPTKYQIGKPWPIIRALAQYSPNLLQQVSVICWLPGTREHKMNV